MDTNELFTCGPIENDLFVAVDRVAVLFAFIFFESVRCGFEPVKSPVLLRVVIAFPQIVWTRLDVRKLSQLKIYYFF